MPSRHGQISDRQQQSTALLRRANQLWQELTLEQAEAWQRYALGLAERNPNTGLMRIPRAVNIFCGLTAKYLQIHGGLSAPLAPPTGQFMGDGVAVALSAASGELVFTSDSANREDVLTELLAQRLVNKNNRPQPRAYRSLGFVAFDGPGDSASCPVLLAGTYAAAIRFVEASTGRATAVVAIGRVSV